MIDTKKLVRGFCLFASLFLLWASPSFAKADAAKKNPATAKTGACKLICGEELFKCVDDVEKTRCSDKFKYEVFGAVPRCPHFIEYSAKIKCPSESDEL